jgi:hypothetical protein
MLRVNQRQRNEWTAILVPGSEAQAIAANWLDGSTLMSRRARRRARTETKKFAPELSMLPKL